VRRLASTILIASALVATDAAAQRPLPIKDSTRVRLQFLKVPTVDRYGLLVRQYGDTLLYDGFRSRELIRIRQIELAGIQVPAAPGTIGFEGQGRYTVIGGVVGLIASTLLQLHGDARPLKERFNFPVVVVGAGLGAGAGRLFATVRSRTQWVSVPLGPVSPRLP